MTTYDIKNAAHNAALEGAIVCMRRGTTTTNSPAQLGKSYILLYQEMFVKIENFLLEKYGYAPR